MNNRRSLLQAAAISPLALLMRPAEAQPVPRTYVLVHGAYLGGWIWRRVADQLRAAGGRVYTPTLTGLGERAHLLTPQVGLDTFAQDILAVFAMEDLSDVILVGHSLSAMTVSMVADQVPDQIRHLVFVDGVLLTGEQNLLSLLPPDYAGKIRSSARDSSGGVSAPSPGAKAFGVTDPDDVAWMDRHMRPQPMKSYEDTARLRNPIGNGRPATYIASTPARPGFGPVHDFARQQPGWNYVEFANAGHDPMVTRTVELTNTLLKSA